MQYTYTCMHTYQQVAVLLFVCLETGSSLLQVSLPGTQYAAQAFNSVSSSAKASQMLALLTLAIMPC